MIQSLSFALADIVAFVATDAMENLLGMRKTEKELRLSSRAPPS